MEQNVSTVSPVKKEKSVWFYAARRWQLYIFLIIPVIYILIFAYYPMFGVQIAFKDFVATEGIWGSKWVGLKHFQKFFSSYMLPRIVKNTLTISIYNIATAFPLAIIFALMINTVKNLKFKKTVQTITYIPYFISVVVLVGMIIQIFSPVTGLYGALYRTITGSSNYPQDILGKPSVFIHMFIWSGRWQGLGWSTIVYIAGLSAVDPELHEAAMIDGASRFSRIIHIDLPTIIPTASILLILDFGSIMNVGYEKVYLMQNSLNLSTSEVISTYIYKQMVLSGQNNYSYSAAVGLFNSLINCTLLVVVNTISSKLGEGNSLW